MAVNAGIQRILLWIASLAMLAMTVQIVVDVVLRYFFNAPLVGTIEIVSAYYMVGVVFLPLAAVQAERGHIIVELFTQNLSPRTNRFLDAAAYSMCLALLVFYIRESIYLAMAKTASLERLEATLYDIPVWPTRWFVPLGLIAMALCMAVQIVTMLAGPQDQRPAPQS